jgi:hypothetical protein
MFVPRSVGTTLGVLVGRDCLEYTCMQYTRDSLVHRKTPGWRGGRTAPALRTPGRGERDHAGEWTTLTDVGTADGEGCLAEQRAIDVPDEADQRRFGRVKRGRARDRHGAGDGGIGDLLFGHRLAIRRDEFG